MHVNSMTWIKRVRIQTLLKPDLMPWKFRAKRASSISRSSQNRYVAFSESILDIYSKFYPHCPRNHTLIPGVRCSRIMVVILTMNSNSVRESSHLTISCSSTILSRNFKSKPHTLYLSGWIQFRRTSRYFCVHHLHWERELHVRMSETNFQN